MRARRPTKYDAQALAAIHAWKHPEVGWFGQSLRIINWPFRKAGDLVMGTRVGDLVSKVTSGVLDVTNDLAQWSVRPQAIYAEYRAAGFDVVRAEDIERLRLEEIDRVIGWLGGKYKGIALVEGGATGAAGAVGLAVDIPTLITLNLRAVGEYATYCGFDVSRQEERLFALNVLGLASSASDGQKIAALAQLVRIAEDVARKKTWDELQEHMFVQVIQQIAAALGIRLTKAKLAQVVPAMGAAVGGGYNAYFTSRVCDAAYYLYRERFLARRYGAKVIERTVAPAKDLRLVAVQEDALPQDVSRPARRSGRRISNRVPRRPAED